MSEERKLGLSFGAGMAGLSALLYWKQSFLYPFPLAASSLCLLLAVLAPRRLGPFHWIMQRIGRLFLAASTFLILSAVYYLLMTSIRFLSTLTGKRFLSTHWGQDDETFWILNSSPSPERRNYELPF